MSNTRGGNYTTTDAATMKAYDRLPRSVRVALQDAVENWVPQPVRTMFEKRGMSAENCVKTIKKWDADERVTREHQRAKAIGAYKGNVPDRAAEYRGAKKWKAAT